MSKVEMDKCNGCGKIVKRWREELGWLHFDVKEGIGQVTLARSAGSDKDYIEAFQDFCTLDCLRTRLDREAEKRKPKEKRTCIHCKKTCEEPICCRGFWYHKECHSQFRCDADNPAPHG
jgi:hypothetical protein